MYKDNIVWEGFEMEITAPAKTEAHGTVDIVRTFHGGYRLSTQTVVDRGIEETFDFFAEAGNLDSITPPWLNFRIVTTMPVEMGNGTFIDYSLRLHKVPVRWTSEITDWSTPFQFRDTQLKGPFRSWSHLHTFTELGDGRTLVEDTVDYAVPGGRLVNWLFVARDLRRIFEYRRSRLTELLAPK